jgi:hypothetical protein
MIPGGDSGPTIVAFVPEETITPTELAVEIWGSPESYSRGPGARKIRKVARGLFPRHAPGKGREWHLTPAQSSAIRRVV